jgi:hypothetical protein
MSSISEPIRVESEYGTDRVGTFDDFSRDRYRRAVHLAVVLTGSAAASPSLIADAAERLWWGSQQNPSAAAAMRNLGDEPHHRRADWQPWNCRFWNAPTS